MFLVQLINVSKSFGGCRVLQQLSLDIREHELLALIGPSGCGKSTTLRLLVGLESPDAGAVLINGKDATNIPPYKRDVAIVFQNGGFYDDLSVRANLQSSVTGAGNSRNEVDARLERIAKLLGLDGQLDLKPNQLSGGQLQRLSLGRGLMRQSRLMLLDEPLNHLDANLRVRLRQQLMAVQRASGQTMVYVTHDPQEAMLVGDRIAVMHEGKIYQIDTPIKIYDRPNHRIVASLLDANTCFYSVNITDSGNGPEITLFNQTIALPSLKSFRGNRLNDTEFAADVGIRAEDWRIASDTAKLAESETNPRVIRVSVRWISRSYQGPFWQLNGASQDGQTITAIVPKDSCGAETMSEFGTLEIEIARLHFFDARTGASLELMPVV